VAKRFGEWPLLLNLFAGQVRELDQYRQSGAEAVTDLLREYREMGPEAYDRADSNDRGQAIAVTLDASLRQLSPLEKTRCVELSIFPGDITIPLSVVSELWHATEVDTSRTLRRLANFGLISLDRRSIGVHDVVRDYLSRLLERPAPEVHASLIDAWPNPPNLPHDYAW